MNALLPLTLAVLAFTACGPRITDKNIAVVNTRLKNAESLGKNAMSPKEVESILGQPHRVETLTLPLETQKKEVEVVRYFYEQDGQTVEVHFFDNKLASRVRMLAEKPEGAPTKTQP